MTGLTLGWLLLDNLIQYWLALKRFSGLDIQRGESEAVKLRDVCVRWEDQSELGEFPFRLIQINICAFKFSQHPASHQRFSFQFWKDTETRLPDATFIIWHVSIELFAADIMIVTVWWSLTRSRQARPLAPCAPVGLMTQISLSLLLSTCCVMRLSEWKYLPTNYQEEVFTEFPPPEVHSFDTTRIKLAPCGMLKILAKLQDFCKPASSWLSLSDAEWQDDWYLVSTFIWRHSAIRKHKS